jgi:hypothetical protein
LTTEFGAHFRFTADKAAGLRSTSHQEGPADMAFGISMTREELLALPVTVSAITAGRAFGWGKDRTRALIRQGNFPCEVLEYGQERIVTRAALFEALGLDENGNPVKKAKSA